MTTFTGHYPTRQMLLSFVDACRTQVSEARARRVPLAVRHNAYTDYCLALLMCCTGHRPVADPFSLLEQFDLERGMLLISDKAPNEARAWRLVALPSVAVLQMRNYLKHLEHLAHGLNRSPPTRTLAARVAGLGKGDAHLPLFFYLDEQSGDHVPCTPAELARRWKPIWPLPCNFLRHVMATELIRHSGRADLVQIQLGHVEGVDHPLGVTATQSACEVLAQIRAPLEACMQALGWTAVAPPNRSPAIKLPFSPLSRPAGTPTLFGHRRREAERARRHVRASNLVRELMTAHLTANAPIKREQFDTLLVALMSEADNRGCSVNRCLRLLYRFMRVRRGGMDVLRQVSRVRQIEPEPSPFTERSLVKYRAAREARAAFEAYLQSRGRAGAAPSVPKRLAEILCSAALFGGIASEPRLQALGTALLSSCYRMNGQLTVDIALPEGDGRPAVFRWQPDPVSGALIEGLYRLEPLERRVASEQGRAVAREGGELLRVLGLAATPGPVLPRLTALAGAALLFEAPGYVAAVARGDIAAVSLPLPQWVRVTKNRALVAAANPSGSDGGEQEGVSSWIPDTRGCPPGAAGIAQVRRFTTLLRGLISRAGTVSVPGNQRAGRWRKRALEQLLCQEFAEGGRWAALPMLLVGWAVHLCQSGTRYKSRLAYSTVGGYAMLLANYLLPLAADLDFLALDEGDIEALYLRAVESQPDRRRYALASRLREFHSFLVMRVGVDELDWSAVMAASGGVRQASYADANLLTAAEYQEALSAILADADLPPLRQVQYAGLLVLGFRFGLRFGEAMRLQLRDMQCDAGDMYLWVRNTVHGDAKTRASVRIVPLLEHLSEQESGVIERLLGYAETGYAEEPLIPLMVEAIGQRPLLDRYAAASYLHALLRQLTGDNSLRYHHLRHGWVTRIAAWQHGLEVPGFNRDQALNPAAWRAFIGDGVGVFPLRSLATAVGHASEATTLASYTHCVDLIAQASLRKAPPLRGFAHSYALQIAHTDMQRRARRRCRDRAGPIPLPDIATAQRNRPALSQWHRQAAHVPLSLVLVDQYLRRCGVRGAFRAAQQLLIPQAQAEQLLNHAARIESDSGYGGYGLIQHLDDPIVRAGGEAVRQLQSRQENRRISRLLSELDRRWSTLDDEQQKSLGAGLGIWARTLLIRQGACVVTNLPDLRQLLEVLKQLRSLVTADLRVDERNVTLEQELSALGLPCQFGRVPLARGIRRQHRLGSVTVKLSPTVEVGPRRSLFRLMFVLRVYTAARATANQESEPAE
ncbi:hypothetical protein SSTU70S_06580 [Stutzerimonas stutzeri]